MSVDQMNSKKRGPKSRLGEFMPRDEEDPAASSDQEISLEWKAEEWSKCSQTCGSQGKRVSCASSIFQMNSQWLLFPSSVPEGPVHRVQDRRECGRDDSGLDLRGRRSGETSDRDSV